MLNAKPLFMSGRRFAFNKVNGWPLNMYKLFTSQILFKGFPKRFAWLLVRFYILGFSCDSISPQYAKKGISCLFVKEFIIVFKGTTQDTSSSFDVG